LKTAVEILQSYWGYDKFRPPQGEIISDVLRKHDVVALLPTGSGKSLCFQIPALVKEEGICIVVSPLVALMKDQVENLQQKGIKAVALTGSIPQEELIRIFDNLQFGDTRFLYLSPERLQSAFIQEKIKQLRISLIAIDEAHCISEWGHDFRPSYLNLHILRELHPETNIIALTATATQQVLDDIVSFLQMKNKKTYKRSLVRTNLHLQVLNSPDTLGNLLALVQPINDPIIVYAGSRNNCQRTSDFLNNKGLKSVYYHAGLAKQVKDAAFNSWYNEKVQIMVATNAFGMGIDKANVRMVVHLSLPYSIENYVQEAGRAGRDGKKSHAILIQETADIDKKYEYYIRSLPTVNFIKDLYANLNQYFHISYGDLPTETFSFQLNDFCKQYNLPIINTYNGLTFLEREGIMQMTSIGKNKSELVFNTSNKQLFSYYKRNPIKELILKSILRTYDGIIDTIRIINLHSLALKLAMSESELDKHLQEIQKDGIIRYQSGNTDAGIKFVKPREDKYTISGVIHNLKQLQNIKKEKYKSMLAYVVNDDQCRNRVIRTYFNEKNKEDCGICDVCEKKKKNMPIDRKEMRMTIKALLESGPLSSKEIVARLGEGSEEVISSLRSLLDTNAIILTSHNKYKLNES